MQLLSCQILHKSCIQAFFYIAEAKAISQTAHQLNSKTNKSEEKKFWGRFYLTYQITQHFHLFKL